MEEAKPCTYTIIKTSCIAQATVGKKVNGDHFITLFPPPPLFVYNNNINREHPRKDDKWYKISLELYN